MKELAQKILSCNCEFTVNETVQTHYRVGGGVSGDMNTGILVPVPVQCDFKQPGSPACDNSSLSYQKSAEHLFSIRSSQTIPNHVVLGEILRAVDCRLTEIFFACGIYPEKDWVTPNQSLGFSKKMRLAKKILPQEILLRSHNLDLAEQRNIAEHRFQEPCNKEVQRALETMNAFIKMTSGLCDILGEYSAFWYPVENMDTAIVIQIMRETGTILLIKDGETPINQQGLSARENLGKNLIKKVIGDIQFRIDTDPNFMSKMGFL